MLALSRSITKLFLTSKLSLCKNRLLSATFPVNYDIFGFTDEQKQFREVVSQFALKEISPISEQIDKEDKNSHIKALWKKFGDMGLLGLTAPEKYGGMNAGYLAQCVAIEEISRCSGSIALSYGAHCNLCVNQIVRHATETQADKYLPKLISGEHIGALAMSEVDSGSDVISMKTTAELRGDRYVLNGSKFWITNGPDANVIIVYAKTDPKNPNPQHGISAFILETCNPGFSVGQKIDKLGMRGSHTAELLFNNCEIPAENLLGEANRGVYVLMSGLDVERMVLAAGPIGLMQSACDVAFAYAQQRHTFGRPICEHGMIQTRMADMYTRMQTSRGYLYSLAMMFDRLVHQGATKQMMKRASMDCAAVILYTAEAATQVALDAIQILGGAGYTNDYPLGRILRDAKLYEIGAGTSEIRRLVIARGINASYQS